MNLYLIQQDENTDYDTYDAAVVCAANEEKARLVHPSGVAAWEVSAYGHREWCSSPDKVAVRLLGRALKGEEEGIVLASFNAG